MRGDEKLRSSRIKGESMSSESVDSAPRGPGNRSARHEPYASTKYRLFAFVQPPPFLNPPPQLMLFHSLILQH